MLTFTVCIMTSIYCWPLGASYLGGSLWDVAWIILCCSHAFFYTEIA